MCSAAVHTWADRSCVLEMLLHSYHPRGLSHTRAWFFFTKQNEKQKKIPKKQHPPTEPHHSWYFKSPKSMKNQQTSIFAFLQLLACEVGPFPSSGPSGLHCPPGEAHGLWAAQQGSQAERLECRPPTSSPTAAGSTTCCPIKLLAQEITLWRRIQCQSDLVRPVLCTRSTHGWTKHRTEDGS